MIRLNKFLAEAGIASRRKADELILTGRIEVNRKTIIEVGFKIDEHSDVVAYDGEIIKIKQKVYFLLNKPKGVVTTTKDEKNRTTVVDLIDTREKIFPVGRLDYDTTGVLILTNDGDFSNFISHPSQKFVRVYDVQLNKPLALEAEGKLLTGVYIEGKKGKFHSIEKIANNGKSFRVTTQEGRNHFVKNMFKFSGYTVTALHRSAFGPYNVEGIPEGGYVILTQSEIQDVYKKFKK